VVAARIFVASALLALACTDAALADNPTIKINPADQAKAKASLLRLKDFGLGWAGGPKTPPSKLTAPGCPGFNPKESDLVVTGHAEARFTYTSTSGKVILDQDSQVLASADAVKTDFARSIQPKLADCLAYPWKSTKTTKVVSVAVRQLGLPRIGNVSAAYRVTVVIKTSTGLTERIVSDSLFVGQGRFEFAINVLAPATAGDQLVPFETMMAQILVKRAPTGNVA
jgi:hypothetical protein